MRPYGRMLIAVVVAFVMIALPALGQSAAAGTASWSTAASLALARYRLAVVRSGASIYAIGGNQSGSPSIALASVEAYSPATNQWAAAASMPTARDGLAAATGADGRIYAIGGSTDDGGSSFLSTVEVYTPSTNSWTAGPSLSLGRMDLAAATDASGNIYAIGGNNSANPVPLGTVEEYVPGSTSWSLVASMPTPRFLLAAVTGADGKIYAIGGWSATNEYETTVERYDPTTNSWDCSIGDTAAGCASSSLAPLPTGRSGLTAVLGTDGLIYAIGGLTGGFLSQASTVVEAYNPGTNSWTTMPSLNQNRQSLAAATGSDGWLYAIGGWQGSGSAPFALVEDFPPPGTPTLKAGAFPVSCTYPFEDGTTDFWTPETLAAANSSYQNNTTNITSSTAQNHTYAGARSLAVSATIADIVNVPPYTGAEGLVALPGAQPSGFGTLWIDPPAGTVTNPNSATYSMVQFYVIDATGTFYVTEGEKVQNPAGQWSLISQDLSQWTGGGQLGANPVKPYESFGILYQLPISGVNVGDTTTLYLDDVNFGGACPTSGSPTPTPTPTLAPTLTPTPTATPSVVTTVIAGSTVAVTVPNESPPIARLDITAPSAPVGITPRAPEFQSIVAIEVDASDANGNAIHQLDVPITISIRLTPPSGINARLAEIYSIDSRGDSQELATTVTANGDGSYTVVAQTDHLSPFDVFAPGLGTPVPLIYLPVVVSGANDGR